MSFKKFIATAVMAVVANVSAAQAAFTDLGTVFDGQFGTIVETGNGAYLNVISGILPTGLKINFDYTLTNLVPGSANLSENAFYDFFKDGHHYVGSSYTNASGVQITDGTVDGVPSASLVLTTADLSGNTGTTSVTNLSGGDASFVNVLFGILARGGKAVINYTVSSVPLPAMAPLFGAALAGLGFAARRKAAKA